MKDFLKRLLLLSLSLACIIALTACGDSDVDVESDGNTTGEQTADTSSTSQTTAHSHVEEKIPGYAATKTETGLTDGVKCSVCNEILVKQEVIPATGIWNGTVATGFAGGTGTQEDPYLIANGMQLAYLAKLTGGEKKDDYYDKHYRLTDDIDLGGREWNPIHLTASLELNPASGGGVFDGNGFTISNFKITKSKDNNTFGLFGVLYKATVKNLNVSDFIIDLQFQKGDSTLVYVGGVASYVGVESQIVNCHVSGKIKAQTNHTDTKLYVGGITGYLNRPGTISKCSCDADVNVITEKGTGNGDGSAIVGGIVGGTWGYNSERTYISDCRSGGTVTVNCILTGYAGGIIGHIQQYCEITNCYSSASVSIESSTNTQAGGIAGSAFDSNITTCVSVGDVKAVSERGYAKAGSLVGNKNSKLTITNCYCYDQQSIKADGKENIFTNLGGKCNANDLNDPSFYRAILHWNEDIWNTSNLDIENGFHPKLLE